MQLRVARLCLDCEEVHKSQQCPRCASEAFVYLMRWVPERRIRPRPTTSPVADAYRALTSHQAPAANGGRWLTRGVLGASALTAASWLWQWNRNRKKDPPPQS